MGMVTKKLKNCSAGEVNIFKFFVGGVMSIFWKVIFWNNRFFLTKFGHRIYRRIYHRNATQVDIIWITVGVPRGGAQRTELGSLVANSWHKSWGKSCYLKIAICWGPEIGGFGVRWHIYSGPIGPILYTFVHPYRWTKSFSMCPIGPLLLCQRIPKPPISGPQFWDCFFKWKSQILQKKKSPRGEVVSRHWLTGTHVKQYIDIRVVLSCDSLIIFLVRHAWHGKSERVASEIAAHWS